MDHKVVKGLINSAIQVLSTELGCPISVGQISAQDAQYMVHGVAALVGVTGRLRGLVLLGLSESTALALVSQMMGQEFKVLDDLARSGIAELGNVVVGSSVTWLADMGYRCGITPPAVLVGSDIALSTPSVQRLVVPLLTPVGVVEMQLGLRENGQH